VATWGGRGARSGGRVRDGGCVDTLKHGRWIWLSNERE
jgi:hypothetical protein